MRRHRSRSPPAQQYDSLTGLPLPIPKLAFDLKRDDKREVKVPAPARIGACRSKKSRP